jgi:FtsP/CotA-like multicopper oxidase with cupredoxin domain
MTRKLLAVVGAIVLLGMMVVPGAARVSQPLPAAAPAGAAPSSPIDESKVPHYFGPYPNWANSPLTSPDATVEIHGDGTGATATASVGANGTVTDITITDPGSGYTAATVSITGAGSGASAVASVTASSAVTAVDITNGGAGYTAPKVTFSGGGGVASTTTVGNPMVDRAFATDYVAPPAVVPASVTKVANHTFSVTAGNATGGTFTLTVDATTSGPIAFDASAAEVEAALTGATVTGAGPWTVVFTASDPAVSIDGSGLTRGVADAQALTAADTSTIDVGSATGGTFTLDIDGTPTSPIAWDATSGDVATAVSVVSAATVSGAGSPADPWLVVFATAPTTVTADFSGLTQAATGSGVAAAATFSASIGSATGGTFTLTVDATTSDPIAFDASAADVEAALPGTSVTGTGPWTIVFASDPPAVSIDGTLLTQPAVPLVPVFVVVPTTLPAGTLTSFRSWNQAAAGGAPVPSAGQTFHAYVLRPTGVADEYEVISDSGELTVPALSGVASELATYPGGNVVVQSGDVLGFYGAGIPVDTGVGLDRFSYPAPAAPAQGATLTFGSPEFPDYGQARTYSFGASVSVVSGPTQATGTAYGGVDAVAVDVPGSGYKFPTVDFDLPDDPNGVQAQGHATCAAPYPDCNLTVDTDFLTVTGVVVDDPGSGYATAPAVVVRDGTQFEPITHGTDPFTEAAASATLTIQTVVLDTFGSGYTTAPDVSFSDANGTGDGAAGSALIQVGTVTSINLTTGGSGYVTPDGMQKFVDTLPGLTEAGANNLGQYIPIAQPDTTTFANADYYVIAVVQHRERMSSSLPTQGTLLREYVQLSTSAVPGKQVPLVQDNLDGTTSPVLMPDGSQAVGVDVPHYLGPTIVAAKDRAVRIVFYNLLPKGAAGDLFLPTDTSLMGSGANQDAPEMATDPNGSGTVTDEIRNPMCTENAQMADCYSQNRATLHLHGGVTPWISDGTPHQWITPASDSVTYPQGVSVQNVPDMVGAAKPTGVPDCNADRDGCQTFYYTNQQSARLMFYHDHAWGITRLNVYAGEAAGYVLTDPTEQKLFGPSGTYADMGEGIPLVIQDRTFVPSAAQLAGQDPTWDSSNWGGMGSLWYHHVSMPAQNPGDPGGMSAYGRWMYGPWFWPPATPQNAPIKNPYYNMDPNAVPAFSQPLAVPCNLDKPTTWQYQVEPFCEPEYIPGTPNISVGMEQFNDTPLVNGTAYPTTTLQPKSYRFRVLNAANDRFWNLSWYVADPSTASTAINGVGQVIGGTEVALKADQVAAALTDPTIVPQPDTSKSPAGPDWVQFGSEGGFLPAPTVVPAQPTTWITDPTRFDVGNVDKHSLLLAPAERGDVIVDFSKFAGKTLILYNDAPAAFPARVPGYDYYTGASDGLTLAGYGPNTRTVMQVKIAASTPAPAFNVTSFKTLFTHKANGSGVFESSQDPIIVGQAGYNSAYGKSFATSGDCSNPNGTNKCDGMARIDQQGGDLFRFDNLKASSPQLKIKLEPKAIHDEMNSAAFDEFGRMTANLGLEAVPASPALQNVMLYPYIAAPTEVIDATNLPKGDVNIQPISSGTDGSQIWKITHNGVDTHPIHFHLFNVQVLNRVTWDNIMIPTEPSELGWKETVRISPLEDTILALRPIVPTLPFEIPNSVRPMSPMMPLGADLDPNGLIVDPAGNITTVTNALVNFGWEYVYHCHILSHEEMDMMRPVLLALPPKASGAPTFVVSGNGNNTRLTLSWVDNSITETSFIVQRQSNAGAWTTLSTIDRSLAAPNTTGQVLTYADTTFRWNSTLYSYRVIARNTVGAPAPYAGVNADAASPTVFAIQAPTNLTATLQANPQGGVQVSLGFTDNLTVETGFAIERSTDGVTFNRIATAPARTGTGAVTYVDTTVTLGTTYSYRVADITPSGNSPYSNTAQVVIPAQPAAPSGVTAVNGANQGSQRRVVLTWTDNANNETGFTVQRATNAAFTSGVVNTTAAANATTLTVSGLTRNTDYYFRIRANSGTVVASDWVTATPSPIHTIP